MRLCWFASEFWQRLKQLISRSRVYDFTADNKYGRKIWKCFLPDKFRIIFQATQIEIFIKSFKSKLIQVDISLYWSDKINKSWSTTIRLNRVWVRWLIFESLIVLWLDCGYLRKEPMKSLDRDNLDSMNYCLLVGQRSWLTMLCWWHVCLICGRGGGICSLLKHHSQIDTCILGP